LGLETIFYCLTFETSLFVASYDSQGHGGGIRPSLHTRSRFLCPFVTPRHGPQRKHSLYIVKVCLMVRCLAMDILLLHAYASPECVYRIVA
jgi:hypothetical protein